MTTRAIKSITPRTLTNTIVFKNQGLFKKITKRGFMEFTKYWVEIYFIFMLAIGFFMSRGMKVAILIYVVIFLSGLIFGRLLYARRKENNMSILIVMLGYVLGYVYGLNKEYGLDKDSVRMSIVAFFVIGNYISYQLHKSKILI